MGPYEVLAWWADHSELRPEVLTFSADGSGVRMAKGLLVVPDLSADDVGTCTCSSTRAAAAPAG